MGFRLIEFSSRYTCSMRGSPLSLSFSVSLWLSGGKSFHMRCGIARPCSWSTFLVRLRIIDIYLHNTDSASSLLLSSGVRWMHVQPNSLTDRQNPPLCNSQQASQVARAGRAARETKQVSLRYSVCRMQFGYVPISRSIFNRSCLELSDRYTDFFSLRLSVSLFTPYSSVRSRRHSSGPGTRCWLDHATRAKARTVRRLAQYLFRAYQ